MRIGSFTGPEGHLLEVWSAELAPGEIGSVSEHGGRTSNPDLRPSFQDLRQSCRLVSRIDSQGRPSVFDNVRKAVALVGSATSNV
jgi:hypothetical protein